AVRSDALARRRVARGVDLRLTLRRFVRRGADRQALELDLDLARLSPLALEVDPPAGQLGGEPDVLALLADGERQLLVLDDDFHHALAVVDNRDALHLGRAQPVGHEGDRILRPFDDVDLLAAELADDRLHAGALPGDAGADLIAVAVTCNY